MLKNAKKIGAVQGYVTCERIGRDYPKIQLVKVTSIKEGLDLLQQREIFGFVDNVFVVGYYLAKFKMTNVKSAGTTPFVNAQCMAVRKDWAIFAKILQKALDSISEAERREIYHRWVPITSDVRGMMSGEMHMAHNAAAGHQRDGVSTTVTPVEYGESLSLSLPVSQTSARRESF
jgi:ABC-type amino acid transport substrate-binding protein